MARTGRREDNALKTSVYSTAREVGVIESLTQQQPKLMRQFAITAAPHFQADQSPTD